MRRRSPIGPKLLLLALLLALGCWGCEVASDPRRATVINTLVAADAPFLRSRPELAAGKFTRMASSLYAFYRGNVPLYRRDVEDPHEEIARTRFAASTLPLATGDSHPENFGILRAADGSFAIEPNDFDGADRYPYHWDLRRLTAGLVLASRLSNPEDEAARAAAAAEAEAIARRAAEAYAEAMASYAAGAPLERITEAGGSPHFEDLFSRADRDLGRRRELDELTEVIDGRRRILRGQPEADDPQHLLQDLPEHALEALPALLGRYRRSLLDPPEEGYFEVLDAARQLGSGVASWPRIRVLILVQGPSEDPADDQLLELKELTDSGADGWLPPGVIADDVQARVRITSRAMWARPDAEPFWGTDSWLGYPVQVRLESEAHKTLRVSRMEEDRGTPESLLDLAGRLGALLARVHASPLPSGISPAEAINEAISADPTTFADEEGALAVRYADRVESDWQLFREAYLELGPLLGFRQDLNDRPSEELSALYGDPAPLDPVGP